MNIRKIILLNLLLLSNISIAQMQLDWARRYNPSSDYDSGNAIFVDDSGNVYVTGHVQAGSSFIGTTIKYNKFGDSVWVRNYQRAGNFFGTDIEVDDSGNVYVASGVILKYSRSGNLLWEKYDTTAYSKITLNKSVEIFAGGIGIGTYYLTGAKFDKNGNTIWRTKYVGTAPAINKFQDMVVDNNGCLTLTCQNNTDSTFLDYLTVRYSRNGIINWARKYNGPAPPNSYDLAFAITADNSCNVYVTGASMNEQSYFECVTLKYDSLGNIIWIKRIPVSANIADSGHDILTDSSQNVYIAALLSGHTSTIKLDPDGNIIWYRVFPEGDGSAPSYPVIVLDSIYNVYVTAISNSFNADYAAIKYNNNGNQIFVITYSFNEGSIDYATDMALGKNGNIYMTGVSNFAYATVKFSPIISSVTGNNIQYFDYSLSQNYPNPFNPKTIINYELSKTNFVQLKVYDVLGNEIAVLVNEKKSPGSYKVDFNARLAMQGESLSSGIYFYSLSVDGILIDTKRMILLK